MASIPRMIDEFPLRLEHPGWLALAMLPWLLAWVINRYRRSHTSFADSRLLPLLIKNNDAHHRSIDTLFIAAWIIACMALSKPVWLTDRAGTEQRQALDIAVIVDISPSMAVQDAAPTRLARTQLELRDLLPHLANDRLALVAFSANAYTLLPLTFDKTAFLHFTDLLSPSLTTHYGSNVSRALTLASQALSNSDLHSRVVMLISDGEIHDKGAMQAATELKNQRLPLLVLGVGTAAGAPVPAANGQFLVYNEAPVISRADFPLLRQLAAAGGGTFLPLTSDDSDRHAVFEFLSQLPRQSTYQIGSERTVNLVPWLLAGSIIFFLWLVINRERHALLAVALLIILFVPDTGFATPWAEQRARDALLQGDYQRAESIYRDLQTFAAYTGLGAIAYRQQQWGQALHYYQLALPLAVKAEQQAQTQYNIGNTLARLDRFADAAAAFRSALRLQSNYPRAALNLSLVTEALTLQQSAQGKKPSPYTLPGSTKESNSASSAQNQRDSADPAVNASAQPVPRKNITQNAPTPTLGPLEENTVNYLQRRFAKEDGDYVIVQDRPW